jgi:hypothetical protein
MATATRTTALSASTTPITSTTGTVLPTPTALSCTQLSCTQPFLWLLEDDDLLAESLLDCWQDQLEELLGTSRGKSLKDKGEPEGGKPQKRDLEEIAENELLTGLSALPVTDPSTAASITAPAVATTLHWFSTACEALEQLHEELARLQGTSPLSQETIARSLPLAIFVDGHLKHDTGELREGAACIRRFQCDFQRMLQSAMAVDTPPHVAAHTPVGVDMDMPVGNHFSDQPLNQKQIPGRLLAYAPLLVAFSSDPHTNQALLKAGAHLAFDKRECRHALRSVLTLRPIGPGLTFQSADMPIDVSTAMPSEEGANYFLNQRGGHLDTA